MTTLPVNKRVVLRLDNGSLVGNARHFLGEEAEDVVVVIPPEKAFELKKLSQRNYEKLHRIELILSYLQQIKSEAPLKAYLPLSRPETIANDRVFVPPASTPLATVAVPVIYETPAPLGSSIPPDWRERCADVVDSSLKSLAKERVFFDKPVDPRIAPNYYQVISKPMDLGTIRDKLKCNVYDDPRSFYDDMALVWGNCRRFNTNENDRINKAGKRGERAFDEVWNKLFVQMLPRGKRMSAQYTPGAFAEPGEPMSKSRPVRSGVKRARSGVSNYSDGLDFDDFEVETLQPHLSAEMGGYGGDMMGGDGGGGGAMTPLGGGGGGGGYPASEGGPVPSASAGGEEGGAMSTSVLERLCEAMGLIASDQESENYQRMITILKESGKLKYDEQGEMELDFGDLDPDTLWKLHAFAKEVGALSG